MIATEPLNHLFERTVRDTLWDLEIPDEGLSDYLSGLLLRFAAARDLHRTGAGGRPIITLGDTLAEIQRAWQLDAPAFDPRRELHLRRDLGDRALFLAGFFWEGTTSRRARRHHIRIGRWAYRFLAEHYRAARAVGASRLFGRLAGEFESLAGAVAYLREIHLDGGFAEWPHPAIAWVSNRR